MNEIIVTSRGRAITQKDIDAIRDLIDRYFSNGHKYISQKFAIH